MAWKEESFRIGSVEVKPRLVLAPMSGVTNSCFRRLIKILNPGAVGLVVTEFISIEGMTRQNEQSLRMMRFREAERPVSIQIFGYDPKRMVEAAKMVEASGADIIDINSGCPVPKVVKKGGGCELMRQPEHLQQILAEVRKAVTIPLTLKIRAGWDNKNRNAIEIARMAEGEGVDMLAIHGRSREDMYRGKADWEIIAEVVRALRIPVVGSGDVLDVQGSLKALETGVAGLMVGRGALANPWIFSELHQGLSQDESVNGGTTRRSAMEIADVLERFRELLLEEMTERGALGRLKQLTSQITRSVYGSHEARRRLCSSATLEQFSEGIAAFREEFHTAYCWENLADSVVTKSAGQEWGCSEDGLNGLAV